MHRAFQNLTQTLFLLLTDVTHLDTDLSEGHGLEQARTTGPSHAGAFSRRTTVLRAARFVAGTLDSGQVSGLCCTWQMLTLHSSMLHQCRVPAPGARISRDRSPATWTVKAEGKWETNTLYLSQQRDSTWGCRQSPGEEKEAGRGRRRCVAGPTCSPFWGEALPPPDAQWGKGQVRPFRPPTSVPEVCCCAQPRPSQSLLPGDVPPHLPSGLHQTLWTPRWPGPQISSSAESTASPFFPAGWMETCPRIVSDCTT